ncbi:hypothetical protein [Novipirellula herctigrandis]|uniref:hypothetical protein n=1 Tax=Novipirellula herctigrandis TaxID=2527986 RepID=UPI003AF382F1
MRECIATNPFDCRAIAWLPDHLHAFLVHAAWRRERLWTLAMDQSPIYSAMA